MNFMSSLKYWVRVKTHINKLYAKYDKFAIQNDSEKSKKKFSKPEKNHCQFEKINFFKGKWNFN